MIQISVNEGKNTSQIEHTKVIYPPDNLNPVWKEILTFDITNPKDIVSVKIIDANNNQRILKGEETFEIGKISEDHPLSGIKSQ